jgi:drug/metabolite transporter (DMT)-like permease
MPPDVVRVPLGVLAALAAAATFGLASVMQHRAARNAPPRAAGRPQLLLDLLHDPRWRWSVVFTAFAFGLQVTALKLLPLLFVQPLLVTGLLWYVIGSALTEHRRPDLLIILASTGCLAGLSALLLVAQPGANDGSTPRSFVHAVPLVVALAAAVACCLAVATRVPAGWRSLPLALASGICYGVTAGLVRSLSTSFGAGLGTVLSQWQTYAIIALGPIGVLLSQNAYQSGRLGSPALAIITVTDPIVSIAVGIVWLGETVHTGAADVAGELVALAVLVASVFLLAERAPKVKGEDQPEQQAGSAAAASQNAG